jgi:hypothetical protein
MELFTFLLQSWEKAIIAIALLLAIVYFLLVYYSLKSLFAFKKYLNSYEISIKMATVETITLIKDLEKTANYQLDENDSDLVEEIENLTGQNIIKGHYKKVFAIYLDLYNIVKGNQTDERILEQIENNFKLQKEIDKLYQQALFYHSNDLIGYNYWVKFTLTRPFTFLFKFKKRDSIY